MSSAGRGARRPRGRGQAGFSLIESLVSILLVSIVILGIAAGILTTVKTTQTVAAVQKSEAALSVATEAIKSEPFVPCADVATYGPVTDGAVTAIQHLQPGTDGETFGPTCDATRDTAQRITVEIDGRTADIVKRDPAAVP